jgi:hypothetical protein
MKELGGGVTSRTMMLLEPEGFANNWNVQSAVTKGWLLPSTLVQSWLRLESESLVETNVATVRINFMNDPTQELQTSLIYEFSDSAAKETRL